MSSSTMFSVGTVQAGYFRFFIESVSEYFITGSRVPTENIVDEDI